MIKTKEEYKKIFENRYETLYNYFKYDVKDNDPGYSATMEFDSSANAEEVVGYYISIEGDNALKAWKRNTEYISHMTDQDKEVTKILETLYNRKNNSIDNQELLEMISEMIESVEELLDKYDIEIPNEEKEEDIDNASNIYGTDYGYLEDCFREILKRYDVIGEN